MDSRPHTRGDCVDADRPCPWVSCRHHLYLDINPHTGTIKLNHPNLEPWELVETCALDVADQGGVTLEVVAGYMKLTRERIRQIEAKGLAMSRALAMGLGVKAEDSHFVHPQGNEHDDASPALGYREESVRRARSAYKKRQRAKGAG